jgi:hypothetical protein
MGLGDGRVDGAIAVVVGDGAGAKEDLGLDPAAGQLAAGGGDRDAGYAHARHGLGPLYRLRDGFHRILGIDDGPAAHAARLDIAHARRRQGAVGGAHAVGLHDETGDFGGAQVHGRRHRLARGAGLHPVPRVPSIFQFRHSVDSS